jgi:hypothetical protein
MTDMTDEEAERIDAFLGNGTYDTWHGLDWEAQAQLNRAKRIDKVLWKLDHGLSVLSPYGTDWVEKLKNDLAWGMDLIQQQKFPDPAQFQPLFKIFPVALDTAHLKLEDAESIPVVWMVSGAVGLPVVGFTAAVQRLHAELLELEKALSEALAEQVEAGIKAMLGIAIGAVGLMLPGLGLLAKGGMTAAEVLLAGPTSVNAGTKYAKFALESVEKVEKAGHTVRHVAERGGQTLAIVGFYFEIQHVRHAKGNVKKLQRLLDQAYKDYKELQGKLKNAVKDYQRLVHFLETKAEPLRKEIADKQSERDDLIRQYSYSLVKPVAWRLVDDYSKVAERIGRATAASR